MDHPASDQRNQQGILVAEYLNTYGGFNLLVEYVADGKTHRFDRQFSYAQVKDWLEEKERRWLDQHKPPPGLREYK